MYRACILLALLLLGPVGCSYFRYGVSNIFWSPIDFVQDRAFRVRLRAIAHEIWRQEQGTKGACSSAYVEGFVAGFVDYIDANGDGEPPPRAPKHLRWGLLAKEDGQDTIEDWFAGFRHGTRVARERGYREQVIMPIGQEPRPIRTPLPAEVIVPPGPVAPPEAAANTAQPMPPRFNLLPPDVAGDEELKARFFLEAPR